MIFYFTQWLQEQAAGTTWADPLSVLRVFRYITLRSAGAAITALLLSLWLGPLVIAWLKEMKFGQNYLDKAQEAGTTATQVFTKKGVPGMGGILIVLVVDLTALLWAQWNEFIVLTLVSLLVLAALGFYDDYKKLTEQKSAGATEGLKLIVQFALAGFIAFSLWLLPETHRLITEIQLPFFKHAVLTDAAWLGGFITVCAIVGSSNAVNITDGLDGLAIGCILIVTTVFLIFTYIAGNAVLSGYLLVPHVAGAGELTVFCAAMIGASLGFLWFNCHPAQVFMGDTGSLALGGVLGIMAVLIHQPFVLVIAGGVFVVEIVSVMIQRGWFKYTKRRFGEGRRVFRMAPLHHHFQKIGWYESQVVTRFYILCIVCAVLALATLKLR
ncbi:MAG: phospho-N-acetylmuramoyl-pentapeptide-transferase [Proteobacteria bacterium]|nr:phospho-N-acetylmuramoyl-pentapeptide-transferase [Verrucomicrobiota bacterium]NBU07870.1 phospho-N-acetylmuramoyl-pentapeptide-transferase [Pseudomonadota bacterium]